MSVSRRSPKCEKVKGTKKLHDIRNIGEEGFIQTRLASCFEYCFSEWNCECKSIDRVATLVQLTRTQISSQMMTRNVFQQQVLEVTRNSMFGDFVAIELFNNAEACFIIGIVGGAMVKLSNSIENWAGIIAANSYALEVQRLHPVTPGSTNFQLIDAQIIINAKHIISGKLNLEEIEGQNNQRGARKTKYKLDSDEHNLILQCLQKDDNRNAASIENADAISAIQPGDINFDHKILLNLKLTVPCDTWGHEQAREFFGANYRGRTTAAFVRRIKFPNTRKAKFELEFPDIPEKVWRKWEFGIDYILKYS